MDRFPVLSCELYNVFLFGSYIWCTCDTTTTRSKISVKIASTYDPKYYYYVLEIWLSVAEISNGKIQSVVCTYFKLLH